MSTLHNREQFNTLLDAAGFAVALSDSEFEKAIELQPVAVLFDALRKAPKDTGALAFVTKLLEKLSIPPRRTDFPSSQPRPRSTESAPLHSSSKEMTPRETSSAVPTADNRTSTDTLKNRYIGHHVYGTKYAVEFRADFVRSGQASIAIDAASAFPGDERKYDWQNRLSIQVTMPELPHVAAVLTGNLPRCEFKHHGAERNKGFVIERQNGHYVVKLFQSGNNKRMCVVPMNFEDAFYVGGIVLGQLRRNMPGIDGILLHSMLRHLAQSISTAQA